MLSGVLALALISTFGMAQIGLPWPGPGGTAIAAPVLIGSHPTGAASPFTFTLTGSAAINDLLVGVCWNLVANAAAAYNWTMSDSGANAWAFASTTNTTWQALSTNNGFAVAVGWVKVTSALTGGTSTFTINTSVASSPACYVVKIPSSMGFTTLDQIINRTSNFENPLTSGSITPTATPTLAIGAGIWFDANATFSSFGNIIASAATGLVENTGSSTLDVAIQYRQLAATTAGTSTMNISTFAGTASVFLNLK